MSKPGLSWTDEERAMLRRMWDNGLSKPQIATAMGRTFNAVHRQCLNMGLKRDRLPRAAVRRIGNRVVPRTTLPPLPSLSMDPDGECRPVMWPNLWDELLP